MTECLVIGGGLAGSALAIRLAGAGREVTLVEREAAAHDKVCGEFLSYEAMRYLLRLGIDLPALGAVQLETVRFAFGGRLAEARLPFAACSLSRRVLDEAMLVQAAQMGVKVMRGVAVSQLKFPAPNGMEGLAALSSNETVIGKAVFLATGKHDLRGWTRDPGRQNDLVAFKMHYRLAPEQHASLGQAVELTAFPQGYAGLQPVEDGRANLCLVVTKARLAREGGQWHGLLATLKQSNHHLAERLDGAEPAWDRPLTMARIPYGLVSRKVEGPWRLGDQAAVIPSFSGDGMSIALHSAFVAAEAYLAGQGQAAYVARFRHDVWRQVAFATAASRMLVRAGGHIPAAAALVAPGVLRCLAAGTRIPEAALAC